MKSLTKYVVFSIAVLLIYATIDIIVTALTNVDLGTLTTCIFATFGGEILACALIKIFKLKKEEPEG